MIRRFATVLAVSVLALGFAQGASAASYTYNLNTSNEVANGLPSGFTWATVKIEDVSGGIQFTVTPITPNNYYTPVSNFGIADFSFMVKGATNPTDAEIGQPTGWTVKLRHDG